MNCRRKVAIWMAIAAAGFAIGCHETHSHQAHQPLSSIARANERSAGAEMNHGEMNHGGMEHDRGHSHGTMEVSSDLPVPAVELVASEDAVQGWNLETKVTNFSYVPEDVNQTSLQSEGHAHLYVNGEKIARLYGPWYYLSDLPAGSNEVKVTLNTNDHKDLTRNGEVISDTVTIAVP